MAILTNMVNLAKMANLAKIVIIMWKKKTIDDGQSFDLQTNSLNQFSKEKFGDQSKEFVNGYWGLKD